MRFSFLIPVYNVEDYLRQCFNSIANQSFTDYEVIIVDDGSTDSSSKLCDDFAKEYSDKVTVIHKENQGLISARRIAIEKAQGEFCVFVDSDDFVEDNLLETINEYISKEDQIDMVIYSYYYYSNGKKTKFPRAIAEDFTIWKDDNKRELYELLITGTDIDALCIKAIKTDILKKDPIDYSKYYDKNMSEDVLQSLYPLTYARKVIFADVPLYDYRYNGESISRNFNSDTILKKNSSHVFKEIYKILPQWGFTDSEIENKVNARWFTDVMYIFSKSCETAKSKEDWNNIFITDWSSMLPGVGINSFDKHVSPHFIDLYNHYTDKEFFKLKMLFLKKKLYTTYKNLKSKVLKGKR